MNSNILAGLVVSIYILGFAIGPLIIAPMSEMYGRFITYNVCNVSEPPVHVFVFLSGRGSLICFLSKLRHVQVTSPCYFDSY